MPKKTYIISGGNTQEAAGRTHRTVFKSKRTGKTLVRATLGDVSTRIISKNANASEASQDDNFDKLHNKIKKLQAELKQVSLMDEKRQERVEKIARDIKNICSTKLSKIMKFKVTSIEDNIQKAECLLNTPEKTSIVSTANLILEYIQLLAKKLSSDRLLNNLNEINECLNQLILLFNAVIDIQSFLNDSINFDSSTLPVNLIKIKDSLESIVDKKKVEKEENIEQLMKKAEDIMLSSKVNEFIFTFFMRYYSHIQNLSENLLHNQIWALGQVEIESIAPHNKKLINIIKNKLYTHLLLVKGLMGVQSIFFSLMLNQNSYESMAGLPIDKSQKIVSSIKALYNLYCFMPADMILACFVIKDLDKRLEAFEKNPKIKAENLDGYLMVLFPGLKREVIQKLKQVTLNTRNRTINYFKEIIRQQHELESVFKKDTPDNPSGEIKKWQKLIVEEMLKIKDRPFGKSLDRVELLLKTENLDAFPLVEDDKNPGEDLFEMISRNPELLKIFRELVDHFSQPEVDVQHSPEVIRNRILTLEAKKKTVESNQKQSGDIEFYKAVKNNSSDPFEKAKEYKLIEIITANFLVALVQKNAENIVGYLLRRYGSRLWLCKEVEKCLQLLQSASNPPSKTYILLQSHDQAYQAKLRAEPLEANLPPASASRASAPTSTIDVNDQKNFDRDELLRECQFLKKPVNQNKSAAEKLSHLFKNLKKLKANMLNPKLDSIVADLNGKVGKYTNEVGQMLDELKSCEQYLKQHDFENLSKANKLMLAIKRQCQKISPELSALQNEISAITKNFEDNLMKKDEHSTPIEDKKPPVEKVKTADHALLEDDNLTLVRSASMGPTLFQGSSKRPLPVVFTGNSYRLGADLKQIPALCDFAQLKAMYKQRIETCMESAKVAEGESLQLIHGYAIFYDMAQYLYLHLDYINLIFFSFPLSKQEIEMLIETINKVDLSRATQAKAVLQKCLEFSQCILQGEGGAQQKIEAFKDISQYADSAEEMDKLFFDLDKLMHFNNLLINVQSDSCSALQDIKGSARKMLALQADKLGITNNLLAFEEQSEQKDVCNTESRIVIKK